MTSKILTTAFIVLYSFTTTFGQGGIKKPKAQTKLVKEKQTDIYKEIYKMDSLIFYAFNNCDSIEYKKYLTDDLEFYHDQGGLHYLDEEMLSIKEMCDRNSHIRRELIKGTLEVYKMGDFGAVQIGVHRIYHTNKGESEHISGNYKFIHLWQKKDGIWKIKRIISYGHNKMNNN